MWQRRVRVTLAALLILGAAGEIVLRVVPGWSPESRARERIERLRPTDTPILRRIKREGGAAGPRYVADPYLGALVAPGRYDTVRTANFSYLPQVDHAGFPNRDPWPPRIDVAVLGSSLIMGPGVGIDGQFTTLLERRLQQRTVLNLGVPGAGTELESRVEERLAEAYQPRLVILAIWLASDVDNSRSFAHWIAEKPPQDFTPYRFAFWSTHPDVMPPNRVLNLLNRSVLWRAAYLSTTALLIRDRMREVVPFANGDTVYLSVRAQHKLAEGFESGDTPDLREVFFGPLERLRRRIESRNGRFVVVLLPSKEELYGAEAFRPVLRAIQDTRQELTARRIPFLDLYDTISHEGRNVSAFYPTDIHFNAFGNQLIADAIAKWIGDQRRVRQYHSTQVTVALLQHPWHRCAVSCRQSSCGAVISRLSSHPVSPEQSAPVSLNTAHGLPTKAG